MNLLLLQDHQFTSDTSATANERQSEHIRNILKLHPGDIIQLGRLNGLMGTGIVESLESSVEIREISLTEEPPRQLPVILILGMPRPQMLKRILQTVATMGVEKLCLLQTSRVEKSFWQSPSAEDNAIKEQLILGLEQGIATQLPIVEKHQRFRPFVEDQLESIAANTQRIIATPTAKQAPQQTSDNVPVTLAIGPEGGFIDKEVTYFTERKFLPVSLGRRILKVETAVPVLLAKLFANA